MRPLIKRLLLSSTFIGLGLSGFVTATASNYSARRANSVRLVWRHHMGRHAYHTVKGARYSKHLGVKYSTNDDLPGVTWYTDAHEKLYNKRKHTAAIYYHVKSEDGRHGGWIWRGYLTAGAASVENNGEVPEKKDLAEQMIRYLGHGAHPDRVTMAKARAILKQSLDGHYSFLTLHEINPTGTYTFDKDYVVIRNINMEAIIHHTADKNEVNFYNLLTDNSVSMPRKGFKSGYYVQDKEHTIDLLGANYEPYSEFFGKKGLTSDNYFTSVKIGVAATNIGDGMYAAVVLLYFPQKYWDLRVDD